MPHLMPHTRSDRFRRLLLYERESHMRILAALEAVPEAGREHPSFRKAITLMAHVCRARQLWISRMGGPIGAPSEVFPEGLSLGELGAELHRAHEISWVHLSRLDDSVLDVPFTYRSLEGEGFRNTVDDVLTQLFGHSLYHRGQVALLLRGLGVAPPTTDFVLWAREPTAES